MLQREPIDVVFLRIFGKRCVVGPVMTALKPGRRPVDGKSERRDAQFELRGATLLQKNQHRVG